MNLNVHLKRIAILAFWILALSAYLIAQGDQGLVVGTVVDTNGAVVPGASVTVTNQSTNETRTVVANDDGSFTVINLKPAKYTISVSANNFETVKKADITLLAGQQLSLEFKLPAKGMTVSVDVVTGEDSVINTASASMSANVNPREVAGLPLNGRQLSQLYLQAPGAQNTGSGTFGDIRFNGRAVEQNVVRYDGIEGSGVIDSAPGVLNGELASPFRLQSSLENVQEFRVESSNFPAEFGTGTGGQISVVTKSGGAKFHGSVFDYLRNDALDAANFFDNIVGQKSKLRLNQFGGSIGGPVIGKKTFFFFSYEGYRL